MVSFAVIGVGGSCSCNVGKLQPLGLRCVVWCWFGLLVRRVVAVAVVVGALVLTPVVALLLLLRFFFFFFFFSLWLAVFLVVSR